MVLKKLFEPAREEKTSPLGELSKGKRIVRVTPEGKRKKTKTQRVLETGKAAKKATKSGIKGLRGAERVLGKAGVRKSRVKKSEIGKGLRKTARRGSVEDLLNQGLKQRPDNFEVENLLVRRPKNAEDSLLNPLRRRRL